MFGIFKKKQPETKPKKRYEAPDDIQKEKDDALRRNKEAADRLDKALKRLKPLGDVSDLLGGNS